MVCWLVRGKTFAVSKKQSKNKIQNKQKNSNIVLRRSCQVIKHRICLLRVEWALLYKGKDVKNLRAALLNKLNKTHLYDTPALKEALSPLYTVVEFPSLTNWTQTMFPWLIIEFGFVFPHRRPVRIGPKWPYIFSGSPAMMDASRNST